MWGPQPEAEPPPIREPPNESDNERMLRTLL